MPRPDRVLPVLATILLAVGACGPAPAPPPSSPAAPTASPVATAAAIPSKAPFRPGSWPQSGSACIRFGYTGLIGRIETPDAKTVRFTLCRPDGAFPTRLADPSLAVLASSSIAQLAADPGAGRSLVGSGPYRIERWEPGSDVILSATATGKDSPATPTIVLRWSADPAQRLVELSAASVDAIDTPGAAQIATIDTLPELALVPRAGLAIAYLGFGADAAFSDVRVRRDFGSGFDRQAVVDAAFPPGSTVATYVVPCALPGACDGKAWYETNGPAAAADLATLKFDTTTPIAIHVPDAPMPGLPDPTAAARAVAAELLSAISLATTVDVMPASSFSTAVSAGTISGLYLTGAGTGAADAVAYLDTLFSDPMATLPASRVIGVKDRLSGAAGSTDQPTRAAAAMAVSDAMQDAAALVPIAVDGSYVAARADVTKLAASPLGIDPLGMATPGDRHQLVFMGTAEPSGAYCGDARTPDALRLCALVSGGLYGFTPGTLAPEPRLATCRADSAATTWTCTLHAGVTFADGTPLDAGDVLASFVAQWDPSEPLRRARPDHEFAAWDALFGQSLP